MNTAVSRLALVFFALWIGSLCAEDVDKNAEHAKMLEKLYPTPALKILLRNDVSYQIYQEAVNDAYKAGVPGSILNECVATRALMKADAATLERLLPALRSNLENYRPETSMFADKGGAGAVVTTIENVLREEQINPGTLAKRSKRAAEMAIARKIRVQLGTVEALVDQLTIEKKLKPGTVLTEAQWRSRAPAGTYFATTGGDELGNPFGPQEVDKRPTVPKASYERFKAVVPDSFWAPYGVPQ